MKKTLLLILSFALALTLTGCGNSEEIDALRKENEELKQQIAELTKPRPLDQRNDILDDLLKEQNLLNTLCDVNPEYAMDILNISSINMERIKNVREGEGSEKNMDELIAECEKLMDECQKYIDEGNEEKALELEKKINLIMYGNEAGEKTW